MNPAPDEQDFTARSGGPADVAPLGRGEKPEHEKTAAEDADPVDWDAIAATDEFKDLLKAKAKFIVPATIFFIAYYFALPVLVGFLPGLMETKLAGGHANYAYVFALSQFFVAWGIAFAYTRAAAKWDGASAALLAKFVRGK